MTPRRCAHLCMFTDASYMSYRDLSVAPEESNRIFKEASYEMGCFGCDTETDTRWRLHSIGPLFDCVPENIGAFHEEHLNPRLYLDSGRQRHVICRLRQIMKERRSTSPYPMPNAQRILSHYTKASPSSWPLAPSENLLTHEQPPLAGKIQ